ncbi:ABC transporter permease subunit [Paractinoplanes rishiriensis]|uniref:ABC transporter n=1 Tax=Paractinoplanes rishiriensis TaxID=1050105 RepID=A0A919K7I7_9ACTN|nr:ABC transporter permease subunit [Actinoplanes rishiriensis]GIE99948.1 ABC transporter [Actinoplanes rishiriensis]
MTATSLPPARAGLRGAVAAEWTKLAVRSTWACLASAIVIMAVYCAYYGTIVLIQNEENAADAQPIGNAPQSAVLVVQFVAIVWAMQSVTSEYSTGSIRTTLQWVPDRFTLLLAKVLVAAATTFAVGTLLGVFGALVAWPLFGGYGIVEAGDVIVDAVLVGANLALLSIMAIGAGAALRKAAGALAIVFVALVVLPVLLQPTGNPGADEVLREVNQYLPGYAGMNFMRGIDEYYPAYAGFFVVAAWSLAALLIGYRRLRSRDA